MNDLDKKYLIFSGIIIVFIIFCFSTIFFSFFQIRKASEEFILARKNLEQLDLTAKALKEIDFYKEMEGEMERINDLFIDSDKPVYVVLFLTETAEKYGLSAEIEMGRTRRDEEEISPSLDFNISLRGSFPDFLGFLEEIESAKWIAKIENLNVRKLAERDREREDPESLKSDIAASLSLRTYFLE